jgi:hypothetical protein
MTTARLSPAANLLRNSKLFALPTAIPLPTTKPTVDAVFASDTATTPHPRTAAIFTDSSSLKQGDWGLKRPLPGKAFHKTSTPVIRLRSDVDTQEHIADFDSAADHVATLQKWQNYPVVLTSGDLPGAGKGEIRPSAFHPMYDNTTAKPATAQPSKVARSQHRAWNDDDRHQFFDADLGAFTPSPSDQQPSIEQLLGQYKKDAAATAEANGQPLPTPAARILPVKTETSLKRWRFEGPWLGGISNGNFEAFLDGFDAEKISAFREHLKQGIVSRRRKAHVDQVAAAASEQQEAPPPPSAEVSEEEVDHLLRTLREETQTFAAEIASFLDLPGTLDHGKSTRWSSTKDQQTHMSKYHQNAGPPRTHPSAGFSYLRSDRYATMSARFGPQNPFHPLPARYLKQLPYAVRNTDGLEQKHQWGVGGFVVNIGQTGARSEDHNWRTSNGGPKAVASLASATVASNGSMMLKVNLTGQKLDTGNVPIHAGDVPIPRGYENLPELDAQDSRRRDNARTTPLLYSRAAPVRPLQDDLGDLHSLLGTSQPSVR